ncbi:hypothetical protein [Ruminococcus sp. 25CYCFAH16]
MNIEAYHKSFDTENYTIVDSYAKALRHINGSSTALSVSAAEVTAILYLTLSTTLMIRKKSFITGLIRDLNIRQQKNIFLFWKINTVSKFSVSSR